MEYRPTPFREKRNPIREFRAAEKPAREPTAGAFAPLRRDTIGNVPPWRTAQALPQFGLNNLSLPILPEVNIGVASSPDLNVDITSPPEINIDFAPPSREASSGPPEPDLHPYTLSPPDRSRSRTRKRAMADPYSSPTARASGLDLGSLEVKQPLSLDYKKGVRTPSSRYPTPPDGILDSRVPFNALVPGAPEPPRPSGAPDGSDTKRTQKRSATFQCTLCPKRFTRAYNLRSHMRTHSDNRPFDCNYCGETFAREPDRKRHERLHKHIPIVGLRDDEPIMAALEREASDAGEKNSAPSRPAARLYMRYTISQDKTCGSYSRCIPGSSKILNSERVGTLSHSQIEGYKATGGHAATPFRLEPARSPLSSGFTFGLSKSLSTKRTNGVKAPNPLKVSGSPGSRPALFGHGPAPSGLQR